LRAMACAASSESLQHRTRVKIRWVTELWFLRAPCRTVAAVSTVPSGLGSSLVQTGFTTLGPLPNLEPDFWFSLGAMLNLGPDFGPVRKSLGPNHGSELDCGITTLQGPE